MMNRQVFLSFIFILSSFYIYGYEKLREYFSETKILKSEVKALKAQLHRQHLENLLLQVDVENFKQEVATLLPEVLKKKGRGEKGYPLRRLASVIYPPQKERLTLYKSKRAFEEAKKNFRVKNYNAAILLFKRFIRDFSFSSYVPEAYFLLMESYYQLGRYEESLQTVNRMVQLFPDSELTGYAMLRMGKIYEERYRKEDALEIYQTVLNSFSDPQLVRQAQIAIQNVGG
ncbi:MAG: outer membrane protein assembly factor BamD [Bdellovibrio sp.]|nr:MAG: outer membrane protein assembly factor BamD [Bdellovibrio sp.]